MRKRLADLNPKASARLANRLIEAHERNYWSPTTKRSRRCGAPARTLEDRLEGVSEAVS
jgi:magnesium chelatase subunit H